MLFFSTYFPLLVLEFFWEFMPQSNANFIKARPKVE